MTSHFRLSLIAALVVSGCASDAQLAQLRESPNYHLGHGDGCLTATEASKSFSTRTARDASLFDNDEAYRAGWRQGYLECADRLPSTKDGGRVLGERNEF
ncbi:MAG: hypothetical protein AAGC77_03100 [Pseudomonadota bacterium]